MKVLYIAGYGRSGSTILSTVLGKHQKIVSVGEVSLLVHDWHDPNRLCSCGQPYESCEFWSEFLDNPSTKDIQEGRIIRKLEKLRFLPKLVRNKVLSSEQKQYAQYQQSLFDYIQAHSNASIIIDASKSARHIAGRAFALKKLANIDVYELHLVRNGKATLESLSITGSNWAIEGYGTPYKGAAIRALFGWVFANLSATLCGKLLGPNRYMRLRYEDFLENPAKCVTEVGQWCGFDASSITSAITQNHFFEVGHMVGGNRIRLEGKIQLKRRKANPHGSKLSTGQKMMFQLFGNWLNRYYGYS